MESMIGEGQVYHARSVVTKHRFVYPTFFLYFNCDCEVEMQRILNDRYRGLLSFSSDSYLHNKKNGSAAADIKKFLLQYCNYQAEEVWLQTMPKMFGYAFNPVSFWFCKKQSCLDAVLCEVNNTFGERHFYWLCPAKGIHSEQWLKAQKVFHVSPFFPVEGYYQFRFRLTGQKNHIDINYFGDDNDLRLVTWVAGELAPIEQASFIRLFVKYGWMTLLVILRIHLQAVYLFIKRARFYRKPLPPAKGITT